MSKKASPKTPSNSNDIELAPCYTIQKVEDLLRQKERIKLIDFLQKRYTERFFDPIRYLSDSKKTHRGYGFSIMALCCLLIETVQCYRSGSPSTHSGEWKTLRKKHLKPSSRYTLDEQPPHNGNAAFVCFFCKYQHLFPGINGGEFYRNIRNGLLHQGQTKNGWTVNLKGQALYKEKRIHRGRFAEALDKAFKEFLDELKNRKWNDPLWKNVSKKIFWLCQTSKPD